MIKKEDYEKLRYKLPSYDAINKEFEISSIEETDLLIRNIRQKISEKIEDFIKLLERVIQPDANSFVDLYESKYIDEEEKNQIYKFFKSMMILNKEAINLSIINDDNKDAEFINLVMREWNDIKTEMRRINNILKDFWKKESEMQDDLRYLG